jgi:hypothetical protein
MSATQTAQAMPEHIYMKGSKPFNGDVHSRDIQELIEYARDEKFDLEGECQRQFSIPVEWITYSQCLDLTRQIAGFRRTRLEQSGFHHHRCVECGDVDRCTTKDCTKDAEIECRSCHEGEPPATTRWLHNKAVVMI